MPKFVEQIRNVIKNKLKHKILTLELTLDIILSYLPPVENFLLLHP